MKNLRKYLLIGVAVLMIGSASTRAFGNSGDLPASGKSKNLFVVKTDKKLVGAKIEVIYANGRVVSSQTLQKRKMVIDFGDVKDGSYTIRLSKGDTVKEFRYEKK
jgi:hypothetical protein